MDDIDLRLRMVENELANQNKILSKVEAALERQIEIILNQDTCNKRLNALEGINNKIAIAFITIVFGGMATLLIKGYGQ